jgi:uncharacterized protein (DUF362 family)/NAD-dependent dihydropyrimidine dehydrogenase PreA subunit
LSQVYVAKCRDYQDDTVQAALQESLQSLPGVGGLIQPGQRVILKPNLLMAKPPERAITTHPALVKAVAKWVRQAGATPIIADSPGPGNIFTARVLRQVYEATGMIAAAEGNGAVLNYDVSTTTIRCPQGRASDAYSAVRAMLEADAIISLPKLKTHDLVQFTGATKNLFGTVPGAVKARYHANFPSVERFSAMLIDVLTSYQPILTVMDAVVGMEGDGPSAGEPRHIGLLLTSRDAVALDVVATALVGLDPATVPPIAAAVRRGLSSGRVRDVEVLGNRLDAVRVPDFRLPRTGTHRLRMVPAFVPRWITNQLLGNPQAGSRCTACGVCVENCPVQAISLVAGIARTDLGRCIRCYCCHELCPEHAIELHLPLLARLLTR